MKLFTIKKIILVVVLWKFIQICFALLSLRYIPEGSRFFYTPTLLRIHVPTIAWVWGNYDGAHYIEIAKRGYHMYEQAFFPLYPMLIGAIFYSFHISRIYAGLFISHISFLGALYYIYLLLKTDGKSKLSLILFSAILLYPTSFYYASVYNDSLFLFFASACLYYGRTKHWFWAGLCGGLATLTRLNGLALSIFLVVEYYLQNKPQFSFRSLKQLFADGLYWIGIIPLTFIGYLVYIQMKFGSFMTLFSSMKPWGQDKVIIPLQVFWRYFKILFLYPSFQHFNYWVALLEVSSVILYIALMWYSYKKMRLSYWIFFGVSILIPSLTGTFQGMPRYGLHLYPFYLALSMYLSKKSQRIQLAYYVISTGLMIVLMSMFVRGYFVS